MTDHQDPQPAIVPAPLQAFVPLTPEQVQHSREERDRALEGHRPLVFDDLNTISQVQELDPDQPMEAGTRLALKPFSEDKDNPNPQLAAVAYQKLVEHTFKLAFTEPYLSLQDMLPYRIKVAHRLMRHMARFRGYLESDAPMMELSTEHWLKPQPLRKGSKLNGFLAVSDEIRELFDRSNRTTEQFQTPTMTGTGKIEYIPGLAMLPPPVPMRFRDAVTGKVLPEYDPDQDANLVIYCKLLDLVGQELFISQGSKWDRHAGRYGMMGLLDPRTVRLAMPSRLQMVAWEVMLIDEALDKLIEFGTAQTSSDLVDKYGLSRQEINSFLRLAKSQARERMESDIEEDRGLMILRLEDLIRRSRESLDLRVETAALKQMSIVQQLSADQSTTMDDFIRIIANVSDERKRIGPTIDPQRVIES